MRREAFTLTLILCTAVASAQRPPTPIDLDNAAAGMVGNTWVQRELSLSAEQVRLLTVPREIWRDEQKRGEFMVEANKKLNAALTDTQRKRLHELYIQWSGLPAFQIPEVIDDLKLSDVQVAQLNSIHQDSMKPPFRAQVIEYERDEKGGLTPDAQKKILKQQAIEAAKRLDMHVEAWRNVREVLTDSQWEGYSKLRGLEVVTLQAHTVQEQLISMLYRSETAHEIIGIEHDYMRKYQERQRESIQNGTSLDDVTAMMTDEQIDRAERLVLQVYGVQAVSWSGIRDDFEFDVMHSEQFRNAERRMNIASMGMMFERTQGAIEYDQWYSSVDASSDALRMFGLSDYVYDSLTVEQRDKWRELQGEPFDRVWKVRAELMSRPTKLPMPPSVNDKAN